LLSVAYRFSLPQSRPQLCRNYTELIWLTTKGGQVTLAERLFHVVQASLT
jgi:hypothetical protein